MMIGPGSLLSVVPHSFAVPRFSFMGGVQKSTWMWKYFYRVTYWAPLEMLSNINYTRRKVIEGETSWPFCPADGLRFFIRRRMRFITIHFFLLLTTVLFFLFSFFWFFGRFSLGPDLTHSYPAHFFYPHKYCTNLGTLFIIPYWHSYHNN